jgi:hypothetical protein
MTIAKQLKVTKFPFKINDENGRMIYWEDSDGYWIKREWDSNGNRIYSEDSIGYWEKCEYDSKSNRIYYEKSNGTIHDDRPKTDVQKAIELLTKEGLLVDGKILKN